MMYRIEFNIDSAYGSRLHKYNCKCFERGKELREKIVFKDLDDFKSNYSKSKDKTGFWIKGIPSDINKESLEDLIKEKTKEFKNKKIKYCKNCFKNKWK